MAKRLKRNNPELLLYGEAGRPRLSQDEPPGTLILNERTGVFYVRRQDMSLMPVSVSGRGGDGLLVAAATRPEAVRELARRYACDGVADQAQINAALAASLKVTLSQDVFVPASPILLVSLSNLVGAGRGATAGGTAGATVLTPAANMDDNVIELANVNVLGTRVAHLMIDGNKANQASGHGIYYDTRAGAQDTPRNWIDHIFIRNVKDNGIDLISDNSVNAAAVLEFVDLLWNDGIGINAAINDLLMIGCDIGKSGLENIVASGGNSELLGGKSWAAGQVTAGNGDGLHMSGGRFKVFGFIAQDNLHSGISVESSAQGNDSIISGGMMDSNGRSLALHGVNDRQHGINLFDGTRVTIVGVSFLDRNVGDDRPQFSGIKVDGANTSGVLVVGCAFSNNYSGPVTRGGSLPAGAVEFKNNNYADGGSVDGLIGDPGDGNAIPVTMSGYVPLETGGGETRSLADPVTAGLTLDLHFSVDLGDCVVTAASDVTSTPGENVMTFDTAGEHIRLVSIDIGGAFVWRAVYNDGVVLS